MHRSGTSWLAHALKLAGADLGERAGHKADDNPLGFHEDQLFVDLNEAMIRHFGGMWYDPPEIQASYELQEPVRLALDRGFKGPKVYKDPRVSLLWPIYRASFPDAILVATVRHPMEVALSLKERNDIPIDSGLELWAHYNYALLEHEARFVAFPSQRGLPTLLRDIGLNPCAPTGMMADQIHHYCDNTDYDELYDIIWRTIDA